ncbi:NUDIX hydrolase domain-like protein [Calycina marina]|uniref:NUDIX hydrolase domain-like protein n=1 Tax=Calycina marina TaxID=1763456 RepID=A0A9P8CF99_9HELO|nr:NUDIX hydrolase domain-like protein [Calycina marina]
MSLNNDKTALSHASTFEVDTRLKSWNLPLEQWLLAIGKTFGNIDGVCTSSMVFNEEGRILMVQRASTDSMPNKWEVPGGAVDIDDASILAGAARELMEEAGLKAKRFNYEVATGPDEKFGRLFMNSRRTRSFCRVVFDVDVESCEDVKLDPKEHQDFAWVMEDEVRKEKIGGRAIPITHVTMQALILEALGLRKEMGG